MAKKTKNPKTKTSSPGGTAKEQYIQAINSIKKNNPDLLKNAKGQQVRWRFGDNQYMTGPTTQGNLTALGVGDPRAALIKLNTEAMGTLGDRGFTAAHELGHVNEPKFVRNRRGADKYTNLRGLDISSVAYGPTSDLPRSPWGLVQQVPGGRPSPQETYANDFGNSRGYYPSQVGQGAYSAPNATQRQLRRLQQAGLLPR